ncbi:MAG: 50S ribosomal protein L34 [Candidatus Parcubacteria bacterium]|nr:MAG: 50S ribosomal protein L34 [Candidatus Parcubacteria bacterium]
MIKIKKISLKKRKRKIGFLSRNKTKGGQKIISQRRRKGRKRLAG